MAAPRDKEKTVVPTLPSKILVATDGSRTAQAAVDFAVALAKAGKAEAIKVMSVVPLHLALAANPEQRAHYEKIAAEATARVKEIMGDTDTRILTEVREATSVADAIVREASAGDVIKHIVLGDRGYSKLEAVVLGSVAHQVVQRAHCPVTIVRL